MKKGHELKIRERLSKSYLQVIFIASISAIVGIIALLVMTRMYNNALNNYGFSQGNIGKAMTAFSGARSEVRAAVGYMDEDIISDAKDTYYTRKDSFQQYLDDIESSMVTQAGKDAYNQIVKDLDGYWDLSDQLIEEGSTTDQEISKKVQRREADELGPAYQVVYNDLKNLMNIYVQKGDQIESVLAVMEIIAVIIMIAVIILSILSGRRYGNQIADGISKPLQQISERLKTFAEGIKIKKGKLKRKKKRIPIPHTFLQHILGNLIPFIRGEVVKIIEEADDLLSFFHSILHVEGILPIHGICTQHPFSE